MITKQKSTTLSNQNKNYINKQKIKKELLKLHYTQDPQNLQQQIEAQLEQAILHAERQLLKHERRKKATQKAVQLNENQKEQMRLQYEKKMEKAKQNKIKGQSQNKEKAKMKRQHRLLYEQQAKIKRNQEKKQSYSQWSKKIKDFYQQPKLQNSGLKRSLSMMSESGRNSQFSAYHPTNKMGIKQYLQDQQYQKLVNKLKDKGLFQKPNNDFKQINVEPVLPRITKKQKDHPSIVNAVANELAKIQQVRKRKNKKINEKLKNKKQMDNLVAELRYERVIKQRKQQIQQKKLKQAKYQQKQALVLQKKQQRVFGSTLHSIGRRSLPNLHPITYNYTQELNNLQSIQQQNKKQIKLDIERLVKLEKQKLKHQI